MGGALLGHGTVRCGVTLASLLALGAAQVAIPAEGARRDEILIQGIAKGAQTVASAPGGATTAEYAYNDRGRGEHILATWKLDARGRLVEYTARGNDYYKVPVAEDFRASRGAAAWHSNSEQGRQRLTGAAFYMPLHAPPEITGVLARALLQAPGRRLPLLPSGEARIESAGTISATREDDAQSALRLYLITGLDFTPTPVWLDAQGRTAAVISSWFAVLPEGRRALLPRLLQQQSEATGAWTARVARAQTHVPAGELLIRNARLFDPRDLSVTPGTSVLVRGERIVRVAPDAQLRPAAGGEVIDAGGRFLMPGLWDNHQHLTGDADGALDLANGVTSARDMANDTDQFLQRVARYDAGTELGPRVFKAGIIDGTGPLAGPTRMLVDTAEQAIEDVDWYANHGYGQIKIYSSVKPELVSVIADAAHAHGLRVSGHVPAFMSARQFVEAGADEIQHLNFIVLNFLFDSVKETRDMQRFTAVAAHAREYGPDRPEVREFIDFLRRHHTVLDPTVNAFEGLFSGDATAVTPGLEAVAPRLPPQVRRQLLSGALAVPAGEEAAYREALPAMLRLLKALHDAGVTIIPGTDSFPGYALHHELELYVRAGIPPAEVLRLATLTSAQVVGMDHERGVVAAGRLADLLLVDGDPATTIADIDRIHTVIKGGRIYDPAAIEAMLGIAPRR